MEQVYEKGLWGRNSSKFYSGDGSHDPELVNPYLEMITTFFKSFREPMRVCDLGCGDFNIGQKLVPFTAKYIAVDIVQDLINFNSKKFSHSNLEFHCLDISKDPLPKGDCAILRQVLQHLSNKEVACIVQKLYNFKYVVLTEHLPEGAFESNKDIISGQGIRLKKQSGLDLLKAPFSLRIKEKKELLSLKAKNVQGRIETVIYRMF